MNQQSVLVSLVCLIAGACMVAAQAPTRKSYVGITSGAYPGLEDIEVPTFVITRDAFNRENPDDLARGFFPIWAIVMWILSGGFFAIMLCGLLCHFCGVRTPEHLRTVDPNKLRGMHGAEYRPQSEKVYIK